MSLYSVLDQNEGGEVDVMNLMNSTFLEGLRLLKWEVGSHAEANETFKTKD